MAKPKFRSNDSYTPAEAEAVIAAFLDNLARTEIAVTGQAQALYVLAAVGAASCARLMRYNVTAAETYRRASEALKAFRGALQAVAGDAQYDATARATANALLRQLPQAPREPAYFGLGRDPATGAITLSCQSNEYPDPRNIRVFGQIFQGACPEPPDAGRDPGTTLQGLPIAICATGPVQATSCALAAVTAVALVRLGGGFLIGALREIRMMLPGGTNVEEDRILAETDRKRDEAIKNCVTRFFDAAQKAGQSLTPNQRIEIAERCEREAKTAYPYRGRRTMVWFAILPVVIIAGGVAITWLVVKSRKKSRALVPA